MHRMSGFFGGMHSTGDLVVYPLVMTVKWCTRRGVPTVTFCRDAVSIRAL